MTNEMTRREAIKILNRMGDDYGPDDIEEIMSGDAWYPRTDVEWKHYHGNHSACNH